MKFELEIKKIEVTDIVTCSACGFCKEYCGAECNEDEM